MLTCSHLVKKYIQLLAVNDVSLQLEEGKIYMLLGPNGSGKSTWMKIVAGLIHPTSGEILYNNEPIGTETKAHIAYMPTEPYFYSYMTWRDAGHYFRDFYKDFQMDRYESLLAGFHLDPDKKISKMSSGMTAKGKVALALSREAAVILLDEPLNGIDIIARDQILEAIKMYAGPNKMFIISSHLVDELERMSDSAIFMKNGSLERFGDIKERTGASGQSITDMYKEIYSDIAANW